MDLKVPEKVEGRKSSFIVVAGETDGKYIKYTSLDEGLSVFPASELKNNKKTVVMAGEDGKYRLAAVSAKGDEVSDIKIITVVIGTPKPKPDPVDPVDPAKPADPELVKAFQAAYDREGAGKADSLKGLRALYEMAAKAEFLDKVTTWKQLHEAMGLAAQALGIKGTIPGVQKEASMYLQRKKVPSPTSTASLDADGKKLASQEFRVVAAALGALK